MGKAETVRWLFSSVLHCFFDLQKSQRPLARVFATCFAENTRLLFTVGSRDLVVSRIPLAYSLEEARTNDPFQQNRNSLIEFELNTVAENTAFAIQHNGGTILIGDAAGHLLALMSPPSLWENLVPDLEIEYSQHVETLRKKATAEKHAAEAKILRDRILKNEVQIMIQTIEDGGLDSVLSLLLQKQEHAELKCVVEPEVGSSKLHSEMLVQICCGNIDTNSPFGRARYQELRTRVDAAIFVLATGEAADSFQQPLDKTVAMRRHSVALPAVLVVIYSDVAPKLTCPDGIKLLTLPSSVLSDREKGGVHPLIRQIVEAVVELRSRRDSYLFEM